MKPGMSRKMTALFLPCLILAGLACSCKTRYYLPGGNVRRKPAKECGCPSFSQAVPAYDGSSFLQTPYFHQSVHADTLPVVRLAHADKGR